jgi:hypothetical protein
MELIVGAVIGFIGSLIGGFVTPLVLSKINEGRDRAKESRDDLRVLRAARILAVKKAQEALLAVAGDPTNNDYRSQMISAFMDLELLLGPDDEDVTTMFADAANSINAGVKTRILATVTLELAAWARGGRTGAEVVADYERLTGRELSKDEVIEDVAPTDNTSPRST